ncbi:MAG: hypothetical protein RL757_2340 [Bacteroidota bacterium]|jgi:LemA protein
MKNSNIIAIIIAVLLCFVGCSKYNGMTKNSLNVDESWGKVQSSYQLRADKIGALIETVKGEKKFEQETLMGVVNARASATGIKIDAANLTPEKLKEFEAAQANLQGSFSRLLAVSENYPTLKTSDAFRNLSSEISETENKIKFARDGFNKAVKEFNVSIMTFPSNLFAGMFGFHKKEMFSADQGAQTAPIDKLKELSK